eukprot:CAMPEP_0195514628 /NCGR_PEP_ID=MMETSP0794_2-20130614/5953_1 /TAXON_ID=515487 /ORGANISM="Stephanopyxis turris, Strain CCMP 815" /LENGTH=128 /DNA_ID=CAMNT_0040642901 /DNA_START=284 /DNA_END=670 /DNA_ORIENTATION=+
MTDLGNKRLTILKVDIEGGEWEVLEDIIRADIDEVYIEFHFPPDEFMLSKTHSGGLKVEEDNQFSKKRRKTGLNVGEVDRLALLRKAMTVWDMFFWEPNGEHTAEVYFKKKDSVEEKDSGVTEQFAHT